MWPTIKSPVRVLPNEERSGDKNHQKNFELELTEEISKDCLRETCSTPLLKMLKMYYLSIMEIDIKWLLMIIIVWKDDEYYKSLLLLEVRKLFQLHKYVKYAAKKSWKQKALP